MTTEIPSSLGQLLFTFAFIGWALFEIVYVNFILERRRGGTHHGEDRGSRRLILVTLPIGILLAAAVAGVNALDLPAPGEAALAVGVSLMVLGLVFRYHAIRVLGRYFAPDVSFERGHRLVRAGPYRFIRHPSYTGTLLTLLGYGLALGNLASLVLLLVAFFGAYGYRMRVEETALLQAFGDDYREYMRETKRLIPFVY